MLALADSVPSPSSRRAGTMGYIKVLKTSAYSKRFQVRDAATPGDGSYGSPCMGASSLI